MTLLLIVIYISFISVGLPDSLLGTAWPAIYTEFDLPVSMAGFVIMLISACTVVSSLFGARLNQKYGTGIITAVSTALTVVALFGFALTPHPALFFLLAIPLGLGAGSVDSGLNSFVAMHYSASQINFLQCFYGLGVSISPYLMALALGEENNWRNGYFTVALIQTALLLLCVVSLPLWKRMEKRLTAQEEKPTNILKLSEMLKKPSIILSCLVFITSCAIELTTGGWCSTYFVESKGIPASQAATVTMLFYLGLSLSRLVSGALANKLTDWQLVGIFSAILAAAIAGLLLPFGLVFSCICLFFIGVGIGPLFPNLLHLTPRLFGRENAPSIIGLQMSACYLGIMLMPSLCGVLVQGISIHVVPIFLGIMCALYLLFLLFMKKQAAKELTYCK